MAAILIVDDEEGIREFIADTLSADGHEISQAADGMAALAQLNERAFDLMITDIKMPGALDGIDLLHKARAELPDMEVVVLTAHGTVESAVSAMKLGAFDYLQKPISSPQELRLLVSRALERRRLLSMREGMMRSAAPLPPLTYGDPNMRDVVRGIERVAATNATVLLLGESGTGKEVAARSIHNLSPRRDAPFVALSCAAIADTLLESELFGHEKGAFTGAAAARRGRIELAEGGTLFLDEIGELRIDLQAKLLRVLQERQYERVGGTRTMSADVRWIAATNRDLEAMVAAGTFREDLYHRLAVFPIQMPPLRERRHDIMPLAETLLARITAELGRGPLRLEEAAIRRIEQAAWPGNVRELANALERAAILADGDVVRAADLRVSERSASLPGSAAATAAGTMADVEREAIRAALAAVNGNRRRAAERLGISERALYDKLKRYEL